MKLVISNIAWTNEEEPAVAEKLRELGVKYLEIAPTKKWDDPTQAPDDEVAAYKEWWRKYGIEVVAFQSMLFSRPDLKLFESEQNRAETLAYLKDFTALAGKMDVRPMVFGSPKNRQRGTLPEDEAQRIAKAFFSELGNEAQKHSVQFCIEPNAKDYACDFVTTAAEGLALVKAVNNPGFRLHLDIACMTLAGDDVADSIRNAADVLSHFHISAPMLGQVEDDPAVAHREAAAALREIAYDGFVSIEMRPGDPGTNVERVEKAVRFAQSVYTT